MEMITVTLTLIAVTIAVGVAAWMVALRRDNSRGRGVEQKESQGSMEPSASNDSLTQPARSHAPGAQDQLKPSEIETAVATSGSASLSQGDVGPAVKKHLPVEVQKETPQQASAESASSFTEAKPIDPESAQKSELQGPGPAQEAEKLAQQTSSNREIISPSVEVADQVEQLAEADVVELTAKAVGEAGKVREDKRILPPQQRGGRP